MSEAPTPLELLRALGAAEAAAGRTVTEQPTDALVAERLTSSFDDMVFPVIRVKFRGPTNHRGSRYIATCRGVRHTEHYDHALDGRANAANAARALWEKYRFRYSQAFEGDVQPRVFIPGDLDESSYSFTVVPLGFLNGAEHDAVTEGRRGTESSPSDLAPDRTEPVDRVNYPGAPFPGDRFGWVIVGPNGGTMAGPYRDKSWAESVRATYARDAVLAYATLVWKAG
jgi:hypothetical protein